MKLSITPPEGFTVPEGLDPEEEFEVVATVKMDGGKLHIYKIDGIEVEEGEDEDEESEDETDFLSAIEKGMA